MFEFSEDLIDRKPLMDQINSLERNEKLDRFQVAKFLVENAPSCNPLYRHSKWIVKGEFCSGDGLHIEYECLGCRHSITRPAGYLPPYCEQCGAFMTGGIPMPQKISSTENDEDDPI